MVDSSATLIFDISSDDDEAELLGESGTVDSDNDWIAELFPDDEREGEEGDGDSDDVVLISESVGGPKKKKKVDPIDDVDDDCVILEDDPDKGVDVEREGDTGEDDLVIVGEKGQIACRDYPHARHLCAKFQFASTPHEQHCHQCHCYVCDSLAPCIYWGNGSSSTDHCHSTDQDPFWKSQRDFLKQGNKTPLLPLIPPSDDTLSLPPPQITPTPTSTPPQNQIPKPSPPYPFAMPLNSNISNLTHQRRFHPTVHNSSRNKFNPCLVSQQLLTQCNNNYNNNMNPRNLGPQYLNRSRIFKRSGSNLAAPQNSCLSQYPRLSHPVANLNKRNSNYLQKHSVTGSHSYRNYGASSMGLVPPSQTQLNGVNNFMNPVPSQPQAFNNQFGNSNILENSLASPQSTSQGISQPNMNFYQKQVYSEPQIIPQPDTGGSPAFHSLGSYPQANMGINNFENAIPCQSQALPQPNTGSDSFTNSTYSRNQINNNQDYYSQQANQAQNAMNNLNSTVYDPTSLVSTDQYNQINSFPAPDHVLSEYGSSIGPENNNNEYSYFCEPDPWMGGYVCTDGFELGSSEATIDTGALFNYRDPACD